jgi:hypothetical protein
VGASPTSAASLLGDHEIAPNIIDRQLALLPGGVAAAPGTPPPAQAAPPRAAQVARADQARTWLDQEG